ncbi:MAG TPA: alcohol dehydrogenase catalytic domain-containing protein, partial [Solirubrobacteraceae bacterium]|nr:alcohol dehydrogenase catalytic domain-containing protein [Solirubrobacteraceae bacterium]
MHEFSAVVHRAGDQVEGWSVGERVVVDPRGHCRQCPQCHGGLMSLCENGVRWLGVADARDGGFAELLVAPAYGCLRLPDGLALDAAALTERLACATRAVRGSHLAAG